MNKQDVTKTDLVDFRPAKSTDRAFILATWLRGLRFGNSWYRLIDNDAYFKVYHTVLDTLISRTTTQIKVACLKDDPEVILGFCAYDTHRIHWVYVKQAWRNIGIARALTPSDIKVVSHLTESGKALMFKKKLTFNPFLLV